MTKNTKTIFLTAIAAVVATLVILVGRDLFFARAAGFNCDDGPRRAIDMRDFATRYSGYSLELEATIRDKSKVSAKIDPHQLQQVSEALQASQEFRKYVVAGYNSCAISKIQYGRFGTQFEALDALAREINQLASRSVHAPEDGTALSLLISQYAALARKAAADPVQFATSPVHQVTTGAGSPVVQGVDGNVNITVDQSTGQTPSRGPAATSR